MEFGFPPQNAREVCIFLLRGNHEASKLQSTYIIHGRTASAQIRLVVVTTMDTTNQVQQSLVSINATTGQTSLGLGETTLPLASNYDDDDDEQGQFERYFSNPDNVPEENRISYILMMATDCKQGE